MAVSGLGISCRDPPGKQGSDWEIVPRFQVPSPLFARSARWSRPRLWTRHVWPPHGMMREDYSLAAVIPRLPSNPSKSPGKKLLSRGLSTAKPTRMSGATSACLRGSLHNNWRILPQWSVIREESSPIRFFISCWDSNSPRRYWMTSSILSWASSS